MARFTKTKTFAVVLTPGEQLGVYFLYKKINLDTTEATLEIETVGPVWDAASKDTLIEVLRKAGLVVRFYDPEEKQWMQTSADDGPKKVPGARDGTWGFPLSVEQFWEDYLTTI